MTITLPPTPTSTSRGFGIDPRLDAAALRAPAASKVDYRPQAILKFHRPSSLDYRTRNKPPVYIQYLKDTLCKLTVKKEAFWIYLFVFINMLEILVLAKYTIESML